MNSLKHYYFYNYTDKHGNHEVHTENCSYLPSTQNRTYIGYCSDCKDAIKKAKTDYPYKDFDGCYWCCNECHTG